MRLNFFTAFGALLMAAGCTVNRSDGPTPLATVAPPPDTAAPQLAAATAASGDHWVPWSMPGRQTLGDALWKQSGVFLSTEAVLAPFRLVRYRDLRADRREDGSRPVRGRFVVDARTMKVIDAKGDYTADELERLDGPNTPPGVIGPGEALMAAARVLERVTGQPFPHDPSLQEIDLVGGRNYVVYYPAAAQPGTLDAPEYHARVTVDGVNRRAVAVEVRGMTITELPLFTEAR